MKLLKNILEEIDREKKNVALSTKHTTEYALAQIRMAERIEEIIRKHMNDGWIPVEKYGLPKDEGVYDLTIIDGLEEYASVRWQFLEGTHLSGTQHYVDGVHYWADNYRGDPINEFLSERVIAWRKSLSHTDRKGANNNVPVDVYCSWFYSWRKLYESRRNVLAHHWMLYMAYNLESNKGAITMTENEAIDFIKNEINVMVLQRNGAFGSPAANIFRTRNGAKRIETLEAIIGIITRLKQYQNIGTVKECRRAVEKQNPTKPEIYTDTVQTINGSFERDVFECPVCGEYICNAEDEIPRYCCSCGQKLEECEDE